MRTKRELTKESKLYRLYLKVFPNVYVELDQAIGDCRTLLDVGCGSSSPISLFCDRLESVGVDAHGPSIESSREKRIHKEYVQMDVMDIGERFPPTSFDCVLAYDLIEHLSKENGLELLTMMESIARRRVVVFTPNGFLAQAGSNDNPWQAHRSGWTPSELQAKGYRVIGMNGWKRLRGDRATTRWRPSLLWSAISDLTQPFVRSRPDRAYQMLCVKDTGMH
jgi:hypothetical protein